MRHLKKKRKKEEVFIDCEGQSHKTVVTKTTTFETRLYVWSKENRKREGKEAGGGEEEQQQEEKYFLNIFLKGKKKKKQAWQQAKHVKRYYNLAELFITLVS